MNNTINCDLVLYPKFQDGWVVFDRWFYRNGKAIHKVTSGKKRQFPEFNFETVLKYILSNDKKTFRKQNIFVDGEILGDEYNKRITHLKIDKKLKSIGIYIVNNVKFAERIFICPISGVVWKGEGLCKSWPHFRENHVSMPWYLKIYKNTYGSEILYVTKGIQEQFNQNYYDNINRGVRLRDWKGSLRGYAINGVFLNILYEIGWRKHIGYWKKDFRNPREFLRCLFNNAHSLEVYQEDIIKSAARYIKKATRIAPLSESTKRFFKTLGALAHLKKAEQYATQP